MRVTDSLARKAAATSFWWAEHKTAPKQPGVAVADFAAELHAFADLRDAALKKRD